MRRMLVTGSSGLIGSEVCGYFHAQGWFIHGADNNSRAIFLARMGIRAGINDGYRQT